MKEDGSHIVKIWPVSALSLIPQRKPKLTASQGEETFPLLVVPHFDLVVVSSGTEDGLRGVKADTTDRSWNPSVSCGLPAWGRRDSRRETHRRARHNGPRACPSGNSTAEWYHCAAKQQGAVAGDLREVSWCSDVSRSDGRGLTKGNALDPWTLALELEAASAPALSTYKQQDARLTLVSICILEPVSSDRFQAEDTRWPTR